jgi:hypothetical protein
MKHTLFILALITASIQTFAQSPRIKLNQITKDSVTGSVLISSPTDSGMVYSRDLFISYGADTFLILGGDTLAATSSIISSVLSDGVTITGDGTTGSELTADTSVLATLRALSDSLALVISSVTADGVTITGDGTVGSPLTVDTATVIATKGDLSDYVTIAGTETITGAKTFSTDVEIDGKLDLNDGSDNVFIGTGAGTLNEGISVVGLGREALQFNSGDYSIAFGTQALARNFADYSYGFGYLALYYNSGAFTSGFGYYALASNSGGSSNGFGREALRNNSGATSNGFGNYALSNNKAANNTAIGHQAGYETSDLTGGSNTFLGYNASYGGNTTITNATAVGANVTLSNSNTVILGNGADVGIGTTSPDYDLEVVGKIYASDSIISNVYAGTSDIRLKQDIEPTDKGLDAVMELNPVSYRFIANAESEKKSYGFIAQEIEEVIPDVVGTRHDGMKVLNYNDLISVLTKAIQEQQIIIEELNQRLIKLENK